MEDKTDYFNMADSDIPLLEYSNIFAGNWVWLNRGMEKDVATYDLVVREKPADWGFYLFNGLERFIKLLLGYRFDGEAISVLKRMGFADSPKSEKFYRDFKFSGDISILCDGTIFFPGEPILRVTAPLVEANMLTAFILNAFSYPIRILTKTCRTKIASGPVPFYAGGVVRLPGFEQGIESVRSGLLFNSPIFTPLVHRKFASIKVVPGITANVNHAFIKSFKSEREAFSFALNSLMGKAAMISFMVDTYDFNRGLEIFIEELKKLPNLTSKERSKFDVVVDSGNIAGRLRYARKKLDQAGFTEIPVYPYGNLNEYKIERLVKNKVPLGLVFCGTELANVSDNPRLEAVYKMTELKRQDGSVEHKAKLAIGKVSYPGRKQIFRLYDKAGKMRQDIIGLENEKLGTPLLTQFIKAGKQVQKFDNLETVKKRIESELKALPKKYQAIERPPEYPVKISPKLTKLFERVKKQHG